MMHDHSRFSAARAYGGDVHDRVTRFLPMVRKLAWHLSGSTGPSIDVEDLMQAGLVALTECAQRHDGPSEDGFAAYAKLRVRGAMVDLLRRSSSDARGTREKRRRIEKAEQELRTALGREPTSQEVAEAMGLTVEEFQRLRSDAVAIQLSSIDECYSDSNVAFADVDDDAENRLLRAEDSAMLIQAITSLPERLQLIVQLYFVEELNLTEIASVLNVSVPRVHQLKASALEKLRLACIISDDA
ncbi:FliA/WhiG family RNA polymerase sigma factor [Altererythrobacter xixiisoli]|uniref:FliA/WhiG family RNA polymerase sigma factor n=1 Tax=Croceibacterium xixiisoli TaxID=1476466 RepID=A0A6I4TRC0_9SPHN|nr:FliA/WhiG family RNA polymerase sigma factor [Croceibacterium xixiisoli]MXO98486.1 FliA/WhiG family RNA polymerase sigma factor [Croceibacterium xixiisoli]